jgi:hypothetical protein
MPPAPLPVRLKTSPVVRRAMPTRLVLARAEAKARRLWREHEPSRTYALATMEKVVAGTARAPELEDLARRFLIEVAAWDALFWQPWQPALVDAGSRERVLAALSSGPAVFSSCHLGPFFNKAGTLALALGVETCVVGGEWFFQEPSHDYWGRRLARWSLGVPPLPTVLPRGSFAPLSAMLERGHSVLVYFDLPGPCETTYLGKQVMLVNGTARLAVASGAPVVPLRSIREGHRVRLEAGEAIDPSGLSVEEVHARLARVHEAWVLEDPAAMADPAEFAWGEAATPSGWGRPPRAQEPAAHG